jgi:hypothetical protein
MGIDDPKGTLPTSRAGLKHSRQTCRQGQQTSKAVEAKAISKEDIGILSNVPDL